MGRKVHSLKKLLLGLNEMVYIKATSYTGCQTLGIKGDNDRHSLFFTPSSSTVAFKISPLD